MGQQAIGWPQHMRRPHPHARWPPRLGGWGGRSPSLGRSTWVGSIKWVSAAHGVAAAPWSTAVAPPRDRAEVCVLEEHRTDPANAALEEQQLFQFLKEAKEQNPFVVELLTFHPAFEAHLPKDSDLPPWEDSTAEVAMGAIAMSPGTPTRMIPNITTMLNRCSHGARRASRTHALHPMGVRMARIVCQFGATRGAERY